MKKGFLLLGLMAFALVSCEESQETEQKVEKKAAREVELSSEVVGDSTLHIVTQKFWVENKLIATKISNFKTINLKKTKDTVEDEDGNLKPIEYETKFPIFVTVK